MNSPSYKRYGAIGIKICPRWKESFSNFLEDMGERPKNTTLDRINPFGDYEPSNCKWSSPKEQEENKRKNWIDKLDDKDLVLSEHITADLFKCSVENLDNKEFIENILSEAAKISGSNIIHSFSHEFENQGLSSILVLSESHISYHSFPEKKEYAAIDLFTCSKTGNSLKAIIYIANMLQAKGISISYFKRANNLGISKIKRCDFLLNSDEHLELSSKNVVEVIKNALNPIKYPSISMDRDTER
jgi:S-adenosylmethionine decarboxylase proenzyme